MAPGRVQGKSPVGVPGGEDPWTLKALNIYEIIRPLYYTRTPNVYEYSYHNVLGSDPALWPLVGSRAEAPAESS